MKINRTLLLILVAIVVFTTAQAAYFYWSISKTKPVDGIAGNGQAENARLGDFANCILVENGKATLIINRKQTAILNLSNQTEIDVKLQALDSLNIIYTVDADYKSIVRVLNSVAASGIAHYKLLRK